MATMRREPFGGPGVPKPGPEQEQSQSQSQDDDDKGTPSYVTDNPSVYGEPPPPEKEDGS